MTDDSAHAHRPRRGWWNIAVATAHDLDKDDCLGLAAQLAFYFLLALFPGLLFVVAVLGYLPAQDAMTELLALVALVAPPDVVDLLTAHLQTIAADGRAELATLGLVGALWSSSTAMAAIIKAMNRTYGVRDWRPWWQRRALAIALTLAAGLFTSCALLLILGGTDVAIAVARWAGPGAGDGLSPMWSLGRWLVMVGLVVVALDVIYFVAPNRVQRWGWASPGALVATGVWIASSFGFKLYLTSLGSLNATYGAIGGVIVVLIWLYMSGLAVLIGAEVNSVIADDRPSR